ncbi:MAG: ABC transporter permease subunit [Chromatiales bacterium]
MATTLDAASSLARADAAVARRRRLWREVKDRAFKHLMGVGGSAVIVAIVLIFFYLLYVVYPLFKPAHMEPLASYVLPGSGTAKTLYIATEEYGEVGVRVADDGTIMFFQTLDGTVRSKVKPPALAQADAAPFAAGYLPQGMLAFGLSDGTALIMKPAYRVTYPDDKRQIDAALTYPLGEAAVVVDPRGQALHRLGVQGDSDGATIVATTEDRRIVLARFGNEQAPLELDGATATLTTERFELPIDGAHVTHLLLNIDQQELLIAREDGGIDYYKISEPSDPQLIDHVAAVPAGVDITDLRWLAGGISVLVGDSRGVVTQWFPLRDRNNQYTLAKVREFRVGESPIVAIAPEFFRKGFAAVDQAGRVGLFHTTAERTLVVESVTGKGLATAVITPHANRLLMEDSAGTLHFWKVDNEHPEVSWHSLWGKVWYESRPGPEYIWQSSAANSDFEPKFSLTPLSLGTLKAAFYAMLFAVPLSIMGAIYTAYFMSPRMRELVKPTIEMMGALPTVILGFLAGLWLAPLVEAELTGILLLLMLVPVMALGAAWAWSRLPDRWRHRVADGYEALLLVPVISLACVLAMSLSTPIESWLFDGNIIRWITEHLGLRFDQRNSLVVGIAMGFAVVPIIFSISEDAIFSVPRHLTIGSLALGATPWQTLVGVVLLTASPGIFSAVMIGLGRAVGETMIVLMATGNTPVVNLNIFEGFRALSANTAVEMPESELNSTHYRVLFLASLLLFLFTFVFNTAAEIVRHRLRAKYSHL